MSSIYRPGALPMRFLLLVALTLAVLLALCASCDAQDDDDCASQIYCPNDCSGRAPKCSCNNLKCDCMTGYSGDDCSRSTNLFIFEVIYCSSCGRRSASCSLHNTDIFSFDILPLRPCGGLCLYCKFRFKIQTIGGLLQIFLQREKGSAHCSCPCLFG